MKKLTLGLVILGALLTVGCATTSPATPAPAAVPAPVTSAAAKDSAITMENLDQYLGRADVQVVDLRNLEDRFNSGYINGTELIPFFQFLETRYVTRGSVDGKAASWDVSLATVNTNFPIKNYFNPNKAIVLFCASGTRAAFMKTLLDQQGYKTFNAGGFKDYKGTAKVLGDGEYKLPAPAAH